MSNIQTPPVGTLPSSRQLVRSTLVALAVAAALLVVVVLPAEYGVDPTGVGEALGLTEMGRIKVALAREAEAEDAAAAAVQTNTTTAPAETAAVPSAPADAAAVLSAPAPAASPDAPASAQGETTTAPAASERVTLVTLAPDEGKEVKLVMREGARATYSWRTDRGVVNDDTHADSPGDPTRGVAAIPYHGYGKGNGVASDEGVLVAAFNGSHGWFWRNRTDAPVTVALRTSGEYGEIKLPE